jgi:VWFA-related protein
MTRSVFCLTLFAAGAARAGLPPQQPPETATFHAGTRLVEVEVVVRDKNGPVKDLTKEDFSVLDAGKPQTIAVFRSGSSNDGAAPTAALPPGAVSNRIDSHGQPLNGATVVLLDQLNTVFDLKAYERLGVTKLLRALTETDRIALYSLGKGLHIVQDFTDDPQKLIDALAKLDQGLDLQPADLDTVMQGFPDPDSIHTGDPFSDGLIRKAIADGSALEAAVNAGIRDEITVQALLRVIQHLAGVPGRKNLVWLKDQPAIPPFVMAMVQQANIALYPVLIRGVGDSGVLSGGFAKSGRLPAFSGAGATCIECARQHAVEDLGASTGGAGFTDAMDLTRAVRTAEEDAANAYTLGYYPAEETLDGRFHPIIVKLKDKTLEVRYRPGYLATKLLPKEQLLKSQLDYTGVGLTAQLVRDPARPGLRELRLTVDLHDIHLEPNALEPNAGRLRGGFDFFLLTLGATAARSSAVQVDLSPDQLEKALETGYTLDVGGLDAQPGEIRVIVRDRATGTAGSLRISVPRIAVPKE